MKRPPLSEKPVAPEALLRLDPLARNHPALSPPCAAVLLGALDYTMLSNLTRLPAAVVRAGTSPEGLPIGV